MNLHTSPIGASPIYRYPIACTNDGAAHPNVAVIDDVDVAWNGGAPSETSPGGDTVVSGLQPGISDVNGWHPRIADY
jgi:hypothetical protein